MTDPARGLRKYPLRLTAMSEAEVAQHFVTLSRLDSDGGARGMSAALPSPFLMRHPAAPDDISQGFLACLFELQEMLRAGGGMAAVSLAPQSESQSVFGCMAMLRAYHDARGDTARTELLVFASAGEVVAIAAAQCGYAVRKITPGATSLKAAAGPHTAALLVTVAHAADLFSIVRDAGGLICGIGDVADADMLGSATGGDHETRVWYIMASQPLAHFLPLPLAARKKDEYRLLTEKDRPLSIGRLSAQLTQAEALLQCFARRHATQAASLGTDA